MILCDAHPDGPELLEPLLNSFTTLNGNNATLICGTNLAGNPEPMIQWFSNTGERITEDSSNIILSNSTEVVSLTIINATLSNAGIWSCTLSSVTTNGTIIQQLHRNITLTVIGKKTLALMTVNNHYNIFMLQLLPILQ